MGSVPPNQKHCIEHGRGSKPSMGICSYNSYRNRKWKLYLFMPILEMKILKLSAVKSLAQGHMLRDAEQGLNPDLCDSKVCLTPKPSIGATVLHTLSFPGAISRDLGGWPLPLSQPAQWLVQPSYCPGQLLTWPQRHTWFLGWEFWPSMSISEAYWLPASHLQVPTHEGHLVKTSANLQ